MKNLMSRYNNTNICISVPDSIPLKKEGSTREGRVDVLPDTITDTFNKDSFKRFAKIMSIEELEERKKDKTVNLDNYELEDGFLYMVFFNSERGLFIKDFKSAYLQFFDLLKERYGANSVENFIARYPKSYAFQDFFPYLGTCYRAESNSGKKANFTNIFDNYDLSKSSSENKNKPLIMKFDIYNLTSKIDTKSLTHKTLLSDLNTIYKQSMHQLNNEATKFYNYLIECYKSPEANPVFKEKFRDFLSSFIRSYRNVKVDDITDSLIDSIKGSEIITGYYDKALQNIVMIPFGNFKSLDKLSTTEFIKGAYSKEKDINKLINSSEAVILDTVNPQNDKEKFLLEIILELRMSMMSFRDSNQSKKVHIKDLNDKINILNQQINKLKKTMDRGTTFAIDEDDLALTSVFQSVEDAEKEIPNFLSLVRLRKPTTKDGNPNGCSKFIVCINEAATLVWSRVEKAFCHDIDSAIIFTSFNQALRQCHFIRKLGYHDGPLYIREVQTKVVSSSHWTFKIDEDIDIMNVFKKSYSSNPHNVYFRKKLEEQEESVKAFKDFFKNDETGDMW